MSEKVNPNKPDVNRESYRPSRASLDRGGRLLNPQSQEKNGFQKLLEETQQNNEFSLNDYSSHTNTETKEAVKPALSQDERYGQQKESFDKNRREADRDDRDDSGRTTDGKEGVRPRAKEADKKVIGRQNLSERDHGEGGHSGEGFAGSGQQRFRGKGASLEKALGEKGILTETTLKSRFEAELHAAQTMMQPNATTKTPLPKMSPLLSKTVLDQVVQYCRLVTKTDGDKELDMQLHEEIFKGLKLRVSVHKGRIDATFVTESSETLKLFQSQKNQLRAALSEKGIDVNSINVIMI